MNRFLYFTHTTDCTADTYKDLGIYDVSMHLHPIGIREFHMTNEHPYALWTLYNASNERPRLGKIRFVNPLYFEDLPPKPEQHDFTWEQWFYEYLGVRRHSRLVSADGCSVSKECRYVEQYLPEKLLGFLNYNWPFEGDQIKSNSLQLELMKGLSVICEDGYEAKIKNCYLPVPSLASLRSRFMSPGDFFPFLKFEDVSLDGSLPSNWDFLRELGVGRDPDLQFHLDIISKIVDGEVSQVLDLYKGIYALIIASSDISADQQLTRYE